MTGLNDIGIRLSSIAKLVRQDVTLYDVGTDHGYLPLALITCGKIPFAVASDVADGPLSSAIALFEREGVSDKIQTVLTSGLCGIELSFPCDVVIAGMGGETICDIIKDKRELAKSGARLILQPMTKANLLRAFLAENKFSIVCEITVIDGKPYSIIVAEYTGAEYQLSETELQIGRESARLEDSSFYKLVQARRESLFAVAEGKALAGLSADKEKALVLEMDKILQQRHKSV